MPARYCGYGAGATLARLVPGKQAWRRLAVRPGALYTHPAFNRQSNRRSMVERKLDKVLQNLDKMQEDIGQLQEDIGQLKEDIGQLKVDMAVNKALVLVNLTPAASLVLGVLYFVYSNFMASGGGSG